jgi:hypothetical protein
MPEKIDQINKLIKALPLPKKGLYKLKDNINLDDYIAILQSKRENKTYTIDASELGGSGTGIQSLTAGDNITVDNTDPLNPIVSASGGGSSGLFPNGYEIVETSRDFLITDKGKILLLGEGVTVTLPDSPTIFTTGDVVGIYAGSSTSSYNRGSGADTFPYYENDKSELVVLTYSDGDFTEVSSFPVDDNGIRKTALRYLYDQSQNAIPLSGEVTGSTSLSAIDKTAITNKTTETIVGTDYVLFGDTSDGDNLKKGLVSDIVALSGGGGGTPAGSDTQIQYNNAGAFGADSGFFKGSETFGLGLLQTQQSTVTFTGSGLDDLTVSGLFSGTVPTTYTVTIDGIAQDFLCIDNSTITGGVFNVGDTITSGTGGNATVLSISNVVVPSIGTFIYLRVTVTSPFTNDESVNNGLGVSGTLNGNVIVSDTLEWTDGVVTETDYPITEQTFFNNGVLGINVALTGHTLTDEWTWTYSKVQNNILDFSNGTYKFGTDFGTDYFGYEVGNNLLGFGLKGSLNTYTSTGGDFGLLGFVSFGGILGSTNQLSFSGGETASTYLAKNQYDIEVGNGTDKFLQSITPVTFSYVNIIGGIEYGIKQSAGVVTIGNTNGGNYTKITVDDVNEHITISNLPAYDDDTAAGVAGLTAGMVYMTTGSGSAPLNAAGILMIKQ